LADDHTPAFTRLHVAASERLETLRGAVTYVRSPRFAKELGQRLVAGFSSAGTSGRGMSKHMSGFRGARLGRCLEGPKGENT
jgi:hypothetical protein